MKRIRRLISVASAALTFAASTTAQTIANGPYYASPSWDQTLISTTRFVVLANMNDDAVLDRETGLVWQRSPLPPKFHDYEWQEASSACLSAGTGNRAGWRLPTVNELASLLDLSGTNNPPLPAGHPFTNLFLFDNTNFWTSTPNLEGDHRQIGYTGTIVILASGGVSNANAWCVRGGLFSGGQ